MSKSEFQQYIDKGAPPLDPDEEFKVKDGAHFEQWMLFYWERDGKLSPGMRHEYIKMAEEYGWDEVYESTKHAAKRGAKNYQFVLATIKGRKKDKEFKATAQKKKLEHCPKCYEGYWSDMRHKCTIEFLDEPHTPSILPIDEKGEAKTEEKPEDVRRKIEEIREQWKLEEGPADDVGTRKDEEMT